MNTVREALGSVIPFLASLCSLTPFFFTEENIGGVCLTSPLYFEKTSRISLRVNFITLFSYKTFPVSSMVSVAIPSRNTASYSLIALNSNRFASAKVPEIVHPAALSCPPPPNLSPICATLTLPFDLRLIFHLDPFSLGSSSLKRTATSTPFIHLGKFTNPSVSSLLVPVALNISLFTTTDAIRPSSVTSSVGRTHPSSLSLPMDSLS